MNPTLVKSYNNKGAALLKLKKYEAALAIFDMSLKLDPNSERVYQNKGLTWLALNNQTKAQECFDTANMIRSYFCLFYNCHDIQKTKF